MLSGKKLGVRSWFQNDGEPALKNFAGFEYYYWIMSTRLIERQDNLPTLDDLVGGIHLILTLPRLLRRRVNSKEAHAEHSHRLAHREDNFLSLARQAIYANPVSPYLRLLKAVGCEYQDLEQLVRREGLEGTFRFLYRRGVYLTVDEFKGVRPVVRGGTTCHLRPEDLRDPRARLHMVGLTGGSRGPRRPVPIDFALVREHAGEMLLELEARGCVDNVCAAWNVPGSGAIRRMVQYSLLGSPPARWFSLVDPAADGMHPRYLWSARAVKFAGLLAGVALPSPTPVSIQDPLPIVHWMSQVLKSGKIPFLHTYASCAVRVCQAALAAGISLRGAQFTMGGEPTTEARLAVVRQAGAVPQVHCGSGETGGFGRGCMAPQAPDDVHFYRHRYAVVQPGEHAKDNLPPRALLISTLLPRARMIMLNVSMGDQAVLSERSCGCPLEKLGWTTHLHEIRSFEKLTAGGMTFYDSDLVRVLEEILPARFGGGPTDYQIVDESTEDKVPRVRLLIHPRIGPLDLQVVRQVFLAAVGDGSRVEQVMMMAWRDAGLPVVEREEPRLTAGGKVQHVHREFGKTR
ncbi:MAG: hypothetical protein HYU31_11545 [Deltaproteobacteria bacterium]|nr:hypothetical protein [Deltaproteobacteria bacterium]